MILPGRESTNPAIAVTKLEPILRDGERLQLDHRPICAHEDMLDKKLFTLRENPIELVESSARKADLLR
jgi:hypothetical protein